MFLSNISKGLALSISVLFFSLLAAYAILAWTEPGDTPPDGNVDAPINTGTATQNKAGGLNIAGDVGVGNIAPLQKVDVTGRVNSTGLCINNECCDSWEDCMTLGGGGGGDCSTTGCSCTDGTDCDSGICTGGVCVAPTCKPNGDNTCTTGSDCCSTVCTGGVCVGGTDCSGSMESCSGNADCCSGVCVSNFCTAYYPCSGLTLPAGNKKIFVTSSLYPGNSFWNNSDANTECQQVADAVGYGGNYKALVSFGGVDQMGSVLASGMSFWNLKKNNDNTCSPLPIAANPSDFFTADGSGNYLNNPILYNEQGIAATGVTVFTGFWPISPSGYNIIYGTYDSLWEGQTSCTKYGKCVMTGDCRCCYDPSTGNAGTDTVYGRADAKNISWSKNWWSNCKWGCATTECLNNTRALYCVEQ